MISYPLTLPSTPAPRAVEWRPVSVVAQSVSPTTLQQGVVPHEGQMWSVMFQLPPMPRTVAQPWIATLLALNGMQGTFHFGDSILKAPRGTALGTPLVNGASQTGQQLITDGWTASQNGFLLPGDWIQLGGGATRRAYKTLSVVNSNSAGQAVIDIFPRLRESPADNAALVLSNTKMVMRLKDNLMDWSINVDKFFSVEIEAIEAI